jgi:hypothetical protein
MCLRLLAARAPFRSQPAPSDKQLHPFTSNIALPTISKGQLSTLDSSIRLTTHINFNSVALHILKKERNHFVLGSSLAGGIVVCDPQNPAPISSAVKADDLASLYTQTICQQSSLVQKARVM